MCNKIQPAVSTDNEVSPMDTVDRIKELCKELKMNQQALADAVGIKEDTVSNWFRRKSASFSKYLPQIAEALGTTTEYLLTGKKEPAPINGDGLSEAKRRLLEAVDDLTDEQCEKLLGIVLEAKRLL